MCNGKYRNILAFLYVLHHMTWMIKHLYFYAHIFASHIDFSPFTLTVLSFLVTILLRNTHKKFISEMRRHEWSNGNRTLCLKGLAFIPFLSPMLIGDTLAHDSDEINVQLIKHHSQCNWREEGSTACWCIQKSCSLLTRNCEICRILLNLNFRWERKLFSFLSNPN